MRTQKRKARRQRYHYHMVMSDGEITQSVHVMLEGHRINVPTLRKISKDFNNSVIIGFKEV